MAGVSLRLRAWIALGAFLASFVLPVASVRHFSFDADAACEPAQTASGHSQTQVETLHPSVPASHCAICHWLRAVGGAKTDLPAVSAAWMEPAEIAPAFLVRWIGPALVDHRPARAPPVVLS